MSSVIVWPRAACGCRHIVYVSWPPTWAVDLVSKVVTMPRRRRFYGPQNAPGAPYGGRVHAASLLLQMSTLEIRSCGQSSPFDENGLIQGLWVDTLANLGAYVTLFGPGCPMFGSAVICGPYQVPAAYVRARCVYTNTVPIEAYRGAGLPEATYVMERLMDMGAAAVGLDPLELRVLNVLPNHKTPITNALGTTYDSGSYAEVAELLRSRYADWREQQSRQSERLIGVGIAGYIGGAGIPSSRHCLEGGSRLSNWEHVRISVHPGGEITVACGTHSHGQGHETTFRQVVSSKLGCDPDDIEIVYGDTARVHAGLGTYASRSMVLAGAAMSEASNRIVAKGKRLAAYAFECVPADVEFSNGRYRISGTDRELSFQEVASAAWRGDAWPENFEPGLDETCYVDPGANRSSGFHLCVIEVDKETGAITVLDYLTADDFGRVINPLIVDGQVHGAVTQGLGQALGEWCAYDEDGQLLSGSPMDYQLPRAADLPLFSLNRIETPAPGNPLGVKGMGEAATSPAPPALANALQDAFSSNGWRDPRHPVYPVSCLAGVAGQLMTPEKCFNGYTLYPSKKEGVAAVKSIHWRIPVKFPGLAFGSVGHGANHRHAEASRL